MIFSCVFALCIAQTAGLGPNLLPNILPSSLLPTVLPQNPLTDLTTSILNDLTESFAFQPETFLTTTELCKYWGYPVEVHTVTTKDGYILTVHRIPHGRNRTADPKLSPFLLVHGTFNFADNFLCNTPSNSFAFLLADAGFDVWVANQRGTEHSLGHVTLSSSGTEYWQYSMDEVAAYDLPAFIDYMLNKTGKSQVYYSGHSLGGGLPFAMLSARPEYMTKVKEIHALAPIGNFSDFNPALKPAVKLYPVLRANTELLKIYELPKIPTPVLAILSKYLDVIVKALVFTLVGPDEAQWDSNRTEVNLAHYVSSMGINVLYQLFEIINSGEFKKFNWGEAENLRRYGQVNPPFYNFSGITVPSYLYYGTNDLFCGKINVQFVQDSLPAGVGRMIEAGTGWNHLDYIWGKSAGKIFFDAIIAAIKAR